MEAENLHMNAAMNPTLNFSALVIADLKERGYEITHIITTTALKRKPGEPSLKIEYKVVNKLAGVEMMLDYGAVIVLSQKAALIPKYEGEVEPEANHPTSSDYYY